jgi:hypothetical protein
MMEVYWTGMFHPANGTMRAPRRTWRFSKGVLWMVLTGTEREKPAGRCQTTPPKAAGF